MVGPCLHIHVMMNILNLSSLLSPQEEIEKVKECQYRMSGQMKDLKRQLGDMREQNQKVESMLRAIIKAQEVPWQEEDYQDEDDIDEEDGPIRD